MTLWNALAGANSGPEYAERIARLASGGLDMHGEAALAERWLSTSGGREKRVLDAGCGTGRVAIRLAERGFAVVGVDADASMLAEAQKVAPDLAWRLADLIAFELEGDESAFDLIVCAGNVVPLLAQETLKPTMHRLAEALDLDGVLLTGFGLDPQHLPTCCPVTDLIGFDAAAEGAGLTLVERYATWDGEAFSDDGYAVSVHRRT